MISAKLVHKGKFVNLSSSNRPTRTTVGELRVKLRFFLCLSLLTYYSVQSASVSGYLNLI